MARVRAEMNYTLPPDAERMSAVWGHDILTGARDADQFRWCTTSAT